MGAQVLTVPKIRQKYNLLNVDVCDAILLEGEIDNRKKSTELQHQTINHPIFALGWSHKWSVC